MTGNNYVTKIQSLLYNLGKFKQVSGFQFRKTVNFNAEAYKEISESIKRNGIKAIDQLANSDRKEFEDLTFVTFFDETGKEFAVAIYDSDELWQDPQILDIFEITS